MKTSKSKIFTAALLLLSVTALVILSRNQKDPIETLLPQETDSIALPTAVAQEVTTTTSAIKQNTQEVVEVSSKKIIIDKIANYSNLSDFNKTFEQTIQEIVKSQKINGEELIEYVRSFDFEQELKNEYAKLHEEDLHKILEIMEHPLSAKLKELGEAHKDDIVQAFQSGNLPEISQDKRNLIDHILDEGNTMEQTELLMEKLFQTTYTTMTVAMKPEININEAQEQSKKIAKTQAQAQLTAVKKVMDMNYNYMSEEDLQEYFHYLQKVNARDATALSLNSTGNVIEKFLKGFVKRIANLKPANN